jgi:hypothetical protein
VDVNLGKLPCDLSKAEHLGRRKYALLSDLLKPDPAWPEGPAPLQQLYRSDLKYLQYFEAPQVPNGSSIIQQYPLPRAVITSQCRGEVSLLRRAMKQPFLKTSVLNAWGQPMPIKRTVNNVRRWYDDTHDSSPANTPCKEEIRNSKEGAGELVKTYKPMCTSAPSSSCFYRHPVSPLSPMRTMWKVPCVMVLTAYLGRLPVRTYSPLASKQSRILHFDQMLICAGVVQLSIRTNKNTTQRSQSKDLADHSAPSAA